MDIILAILILILIIGVLGFLSLALQAWGISLNDFFSSTRLMLLGIELTIISFLIANDPDRQIIRGILTVLGISIFFSGFIKVEGDKSRAAEKSSR